MSDPVNPSGEVRLEQERLIITFAFDVDLVFKVRALPERTWNAAEKYWSVPLRHYPAVKEAFPTFKLDQEMDRFLQDKTDSIDVTYSAA